MIFSNVLLKTDYQLNLTGWECKKLVADDQLNSIVPID